MTHPKGDETMGKPLNLAEIHQELLHELFGDTIPEGEAFTANRTDYSNAMKKVQDKHGLKQGHPQFASWLMTMLMQSPTITEDEGDE